MLLAISLHSYLYEASSIFYLQGIYVTTQVLHGLKNASAYLKISIFPLFGFIQNAIDS